MHRDISPDNVLLPQGRLDQAKIIDFGIAGETTLAHQTIVGDSFAGKLGYVAPEQFGDFGLRIGPWTDVYSLALVGLALAGGKAPDMGATLADAVDRRRQGGDLTVMPETLRPVFARMLAPNPLDRFQTMDEVVVALDALGDISGAVEDEAPWPVHAPGPLALMLHGSAHSGSGAADRSSFSAPTRVQTDTASPRRPPWLAYGLAGVALAAAGMFGPALLAGLSSRQASPPAVVQVPVAALPVQTAPAAPQPSPPAASGSAPAPPGAPPPCANSAAGAPVGCGAVKAGQGARPAPAKASGRVLPKLIAPRAVAPAPILILPTSDKTPHTQPETRPVATSSSASDDAPQACWRADGTEWKYLGYASRGACVAEVFDGYCQTVYGRWGDRPLRRYDGKLQLKTSGLFTTWKTLSPSQCAATPVEEHR